MVECVILFRNTLNGIVGFVGNQEYPTIFDDREEAIEAARTIPVCKVYPWQIVELDEL